MDNFKISDTNHDTKEKRWNFLCGACKNENWIWVVKCIWKRRGWLAGWLDGWMAGWLKVRMTDATKYIFIYVQTLSTVLIHKKVAQIELYESLGKIVSIKLIPLQMCSPRLPLAAWRNGLKAECVGKYGHFRRMSRRNVMGRCEKNLATVGKFTANKQ